MASVIVLIVGILFIVFGIGELITALRIRKISKDILKQNSELWNIMSDIKNRMR